jgi:hypothetical protein
MCSGWPYSAGNGNKCVSFKLKLTALSPMAMPSVCVCLRIINERKQMMKRANVAYQPMKEEISMSANVEIIFICSNVIS